jgi:hypothetical protein
LQFPLILSLSHLLIIFLQSPFATFILTHLLHIHTSTNTSFTFLPTLHPSNTSFTFPPLSPSPFPYLNISPTTTSFTSPSLILLISPSIFTFPHLLHYIQHLQFFTSPPVPPPTHTCGTQLTLFLHGF